MMEINQHRKLRDEPTSDCRSFGSHNQPCSQSRKISIGVMAEEPAKLRHETRKGGETTLPNAKRVPSSGEKNVEENNKGPRVMASFRRKQSGTSAHENSPWVSTRPTTKTVHFFENGTSNLQSGDGAHKISSTREQPMTKTVQLLANQTSILLSENGGQEQFHNMNEGPVTKTFKFYANQTSILHSSNGVQKKFDSITYGRTRAKGGSSERVEEFAFAAAQEVHESDKGDGKNENTAGQGKDALKSKLWEILGTAPSENEHNSNAQTLENCVKSSGLGDHLIRKGVEAVKPRQNSDTIETDSESPNGTLKRPVTRSLTRRKTPNTKQPKLPAKIKKEGQLSTLLNYTQKGQEQNIFVFKEAGGLGSLHRTGYGGSILLTNKKNERKSSKVEPRRISFSEKSRQTSEKERPSPAKKRISQNYRTESYHNYPPKTNIECLQPENGILEEELHHSPAQKIPDREEYLNSPKVPKEADSQENHGFQFLKKNVKQHYNVNSLTSEIKAPTEKYSPTAPSPKTNPLESSVQSPVLVKRRFMSEGFCNLRTSQTLKPASSGSEAQTASPEDSRDSPIKEASHVIEEKDKEDCLSQSSKEQDVESLEGDLLINKGCQLTEKWPQEASLPEKPPFMLRPSKRFCSQAHTDFSESEPTPLSPKGTISQSTGIQGPSDENHDDGLARAVALFAFALEKFKTRMKAETSKRSSEILVSVTEEIKLQLQNVDTQIQGDVMKFTSLGKSKRKRLETRFQEQQERLKHIHDKFKEELNQHLQDCRSTLDDLEAYQLELKGNADRQNTSHRKLLVQVEQAIETQLGEAERRITSVQRVAREKMFQLKHAITECLKDGVFS